MIAGLDLSLTCTGIALISDNGEVNTHRVQSKGRKNMPAGETAMRIWLMVEKIAMTLCYDPDYMRDSIEPVHLAVIEAPSFGSKGGAAHERGGLWWGVAGRLAELEVPIATVAPKTRAIYGVGHGSGKGAAGKREVKLATQARYPDVDIPDDNVADAVLLAAMGARHLGRPIDGDLEPKFTRALSSTRWG